MVGVFQYINFQYLELFRMRNFDNIHPEEVDTLLVHNIAMYNSFNYLGTIFSGMIFLHLITKLIFNVFATLKMPIDKWSIIELFCAALNLICFNVIGSATKEQFLDP